MMSLAEFIEKYGTHPAQELLDFLVIKQMKIEGVRDMLIRWKVINRRTKYAHTSYNRHNWGEVEHFIRFYNSKDVIIAIRTSDTEIESLRATIYKRGEGQIA